MDAFGIAVTATFVDKYGRSVATENHNLTGIPAGKVFTTPASFSRTLL